MWPLTERLLKSLPLIRKALAGEKGPGRGPTEPGVTALLLAGVPSTSSTQRLIGLPRTLSEKVMTDLERNKRIVVDYYQMAFAGDPRRR